MSLNEIATATLPHPPKVVSPREQTALTERQEPDGSSEVASTKHSPVQAQEDEEYLPSDDEGRELLNTITYSQCLRHSHLHIIPNSSRQKTWWTMIMKCLTLNLTTRMKPQENLA